MRPMNFDDATKADEWWARLPPFMKRHVMQGELQKRAEIEERLRDEIANQGNC